MDTPKAHVTDILMRILAWAWMVLPPVIIGNLTLWSAMEVSEKRLSWRGRFFIVLGSLGLASVMHRVCETYQLQRHEWICIFLISFVSQHILKFAYAELGGIMKDAVRAQLQRFVKGLDKEKE